MKLQWAWGVALGLAIGAGSAQALEFVTEDYPPFNMNEGGKVVGISTEILQEALQRSGLTANIAVYPWERALSMGRENKDTCVFSALRTAAREPQFKWVGPLVSDDMTLFAKSDSKVELKTLDDAKKYKIGGYQGDGYGDYLSTRGFNVEKTIKNEQNIPKLLAGRIDLLVGGARNGPYLASKNGAKGQIKPVLTYGDPKEAQMWLACNKSTSDDVLKKLNDAIASVSKDGTANKIFKKYE